jgi:hypothetical protein
MQYQVPQFIEVEDKIFGPLTLKQFIYLAGGGGVCLALFTLLPLLIALLLSLPFVGVSLALAFYKVNDRPLIVAAEHAFGYFFSSKLYLWKAREPKAPTATTSTATTDPTNVAVPKLSESRLRDLSWSLNIKDRTAMGIQKPQGTGEFEI